MAERTFITTIVERACTLFLEEIEREIDQVREQMVTDASAYGTWLSGLKTRTREEAIAFLKETGMWNEAESQYKDMSEKIRKILGLSKAVGTNSSVMTLTSTEYDIIHPYMEKVVAV